MRAVLKTTKKSNLNKAKDLLAFLIEETQTLANRMEAGLENASDHGYNEHKFFELKKKIRDLKRERQALELEVAALHYKLDEKE